MADNLIFLIVVLGVPVLCWLALKREKEESEK